MTPKFTTPCFIRKNTPELRKKLEELGYVPYKLRPADDYRKASQYWTEDCYDCLITDTTDIFEPSYCGIGTDELDIKHEMLEGLTDCGENEQLFLALAALREDSDKFQWFCDGNGLWEMGECDLPSRYMQMNGHKATPDELIAYFRPYPPSALTN